MEGSKLSAHPSKSIIGTEGEELKGKRIVLCITGSVAAVQSAEIARALMRHGAEVFPVMSPMATKIIHPYIMEWATGNEAVAKLTGKIEHVSLVGEHSLRADLILVAPATANTISKVACGIDDTSVTTVISTGLGSNCPLIMVPAMHESMYKHPILIKNIENLEKIGVYFVKPRICEGKAKIAETKEILATVIRKLASGNDFSELRLLITAGATVEHIDPVRIVTNKSSGKMGVAIAEEALSRGAEVTFIYGTGTEPAPSKVNLLKVETTEEMHAAVLSELKSEKYDMMLAVAAAADWKPKKPYANKVSSHEQHSLELKLEPTVKIINKVKEVSPKTFLVAFRAEYKLTKKRLIESAYQRLNQAKADIIVVNDVGKKGAGFGTETNEVLIVDQKKNVIEIPMAKKREIAKKILDVAIRKVGLK